MTSFQFNPDFPDATDPQKMDQVRLWRNVELSKTDWTQVSDAPVDAEAWATYRQQLRDLPATIDLENPVIPDPPA
jgi:hypothetical protein